jgi:hypothetical protein
MKPLCWVLLVVAMFSAGCEPKTDVKEGPPVTDVNAPRPPALTTNSAGTVTNAVKP